MKCDDIKTIFGFIFCFMYPVREDVLRLVGLVKVTIQQCTNTQLQVKEKEKNTGIIRTLYLKYQL